MHSAAWKFALQQGAGIATGRRGCDRPAIALMLAPGFGMLRDAKSTGLDPPRRGVRQRGMDVKAVVDNLSQSALLLAGANHHHGDGAAYAILRGSIREHLARILASQTFHSAKAHKRFLQYVVEHALEGTSNEVKEYTLGVDVFQRGSTFDPRLDPIVRVEARKLRNRLAKYYESEGQQDQVRIELPTGSYVPTFRKEGDMPAISEAAKTSVGDPAPGALQTADEWDSRIPMKSTPAALIWKTIGWKKVGWKKIGFMGALILLAAIGIVSGRAIRRDTAPADVSPSIAVLPFQNLGDANDESFSDGLAAELIDSLGRVRGLHVVARTSAFQFRSKTLDIRDIGKKLNVRSVLEGSVRKYGNRLRITAELDDTSNGYRVWSNSYERNFEDALFVQQDISQAIVAALQGQLAKVGEPKELSFSSAAARSVNVEAYEDYLRGVYFWNKQTTESIETAKKYFEQAIARDPSQASGYTGLARCYANLPSFSNMRARDVVPKIRELALQALMLDPNLPEAHIDLAYVSFLEYDWPRAELEFKKGLELSPGDAMAHRWYGFYLSNVGRTKEAFAESKIAQQLDPVSPYMLEGTARSLYLSRRYDEAVEEYHKALALDPQYGYAHLGLGTVYIQQGKYPEAVAELRLSQERVSNNHSPLSELARAYAAMDRTSDAKNILRGYLNRAATGSFPAKPIAKIYLALGDKDHAIEWLTKAVDARDVSLYLKSDAIWDGLRSDPRFDHLLEIARLTP